MKLKKTNATLGIISTLILLAHAGYQMTAYVLFIYAPMVTKVLAWGCAAAISAHAVIGMCIVMFAHDGSAALEYPMANIRTILQRASAIGIMVLLVLHVKSFDILKSGTPGLILVEIIVILFYACVFTHIATSLTNAFVTLGMLCDMDRKKKIDHTLWVVFAVLWAAAVFIIGRTYPMLAAM
ncbi:MAG: hypothetical protein IJH92_05735 [Mogibacterium sp.]|nr:hypothetical protein [Mogibacterium sp.]